LIDIPDPQIEALGELGRRRRMSRAAIIRQAIAEYLSRNGTEDRDSAFGLWGPKAPDGLAYQRRVRAEW
jgi:predicted transcriptional regulator